MSNRILPRGAAICLLSMLAVCGRGRFAVVGSEGRPGPARAGDRTPGPPRNGFEVIGWMRYTHSSRELKSLAFSVETIDYDTDSARRSRSRVHAALPGKLRVDLLPASRRSGQVRDRHRLAVFERGRRVSILRRVDLAALLAYDVFAQSVDTTIMWLDSARVRFGLARRDRLDGRDVWVVGALAGDTTSDQFWVDAQRWVLLRVIQRDPRAPDRRSDLRFTEYTELLGVPVPTRIGVFRDGRLAQVQEVSELDINPALPTRAFDLSRWRELGR